jgi:hypothetical protein
MLLVLPQVRLVVLLLPGLPAACRTWQASSAPTAPAAVQ